MTACDLSACTKPWEIQLEIVKVIYQEFYAEVRMIINYCKYNLSNYGKAMMRELKGALIEWSLILLLLFWYLMLLVFVGRPGEGPRKNAHRNEGP